MTLASTGELVAAAVAASAAVPAFNVITLESAEAIVAGADRAGAAVLLQVSENAIGYHGAPGPLLMACRELAEAASVPVGIHLDHIIDDRLIGVLLDGASRWGISSIMVDAASLPYDANVAATTAVVARAHDLGLWVEAELGEIGGKDGAHAPGVRTEPAEASAFVDLTGVDALAVAVGSSHAMREQGASLDVGLIARLASALPVPLVLHGTSGVPDDQLRAAIGAGIRKVNVGTALSLAATSELRASLAAAPDAIDPRRYLATGREAMADVVAHLCAVTGLPAYSPRIRAAFPR